MEERFSSPLCHSSESGENCANSAITARLPAKVMETGGAHGGCWEPASQLGQLIQSGQVRNFSDLIGLKLAPVSPRSATDSSSNSDKEDYSLRSRHESQPHAENHRPLLASPCRVATPMALSFLPAARANPLPTRTRLAAACPDRLWAAAEDARAARRSMPELRRRATRIGASSDSPPMPSAQPAREQQRSMPELPSLAAPPHADRIGRFGGDGGDELPFSAYVQQQQRRLSLNVSRDSGAVAVARREARPPPHVRRASF
jgi:hypothetical protein